MDSELLGRLLDEHAAALELYARQWCDVPEDVVQDAFLKLASQRKLPDRPLPWLYRVVRNAAIDAGQAARRRRIHESTAACQTDPWFETAPDDRPGTIDPEEATEALRILPLAQREVIVAHLWGGLSFEQIAELTGSSSSSAHRHYTEGLTVLRERLGVSCRKSRPIPK
jgi:RNA polymerase sigma-70 factor (ECF subfamily)